MRRINLKNCPLINIKVDEVRPYENNARLHPEAQLAMLESSVRRTLTITPILLSKRYEIIAGHARLTVAKRLGIDVVPAIVLPHLNEAQEKAFRVADNAIALKGEWSVELLSAEIELVASLSLEFDPMEIGFQIGEIDSMLASRRSNEPVPQVLEPNRDRPATSRIGDIFKIGPHVVACGDARDPEVYKAALDGRKAAAVISDQPWNLRSRFISGKGAVSHPDFCSAGGEMNDDEFSSFTEVVLTNQANACLPGATVFQFIDWRSVDVMIGAGKKRVGKLVNICVWVKPSGGMGSPWRSRHELVCVFRIDGGKATDNVELGKHGRNRTNVWEYDAPSGFGSERHKLKFHPTSKNESMIADAIMDCTGRNDLVLDAFLGSGTTALAAHAAGRICVGIELDTHYADLCIGRLAEAVGVVPVHQSGRTFEQVRRDRFLKAED